VIVNFDITLTDW